MPTDRKDGKTVLAEWTWNHLDVRVSADVPGVPEHSEQAVKATASFALGVFRGMVNTSDAFKKAIEEAQRALPENQKIEVFIRVVHSVPRSTGL